MVEQKEPIAWEALLDMEKVQLQRGRDEPRSGYLGCGSCKRL